MRVLMFGWEFPPFNMGGLGTACFGLTKALGKQNVEVTFIMPKAPRTNIGNVHVVGASEFDYLVEKKKIKLRQVDSLIMPYATSESYSDMMREMEEKKRRGGQDTGADIYGRNLFEEVHRYTQRASAIASEEPFDIIHAHDWMTYKAGIIAKEVSGKPLVVHVHATEFDRTGGRPNQYIYDLEREGLHRADKIIAVSNFTKSIVVRHYGIAPEKVEVVHNGVDLHEANVHNVRRFGNNKVVLFLGRITLQKGPEYFLHAAKKVIEIYSNVLFIMVGSGDMERRMIDLSAELGIAGKVLFSGFLRGDEIDRAYKMADLYVMPSVSEPFGITPLEALKNGTPVLISKTSGVSEVLSNCLKVDFWDIDEMVNKIVSVLRHPVLHQSLAENGKEEVRYITWDRAAAKCIEVYRKTLAQLHKVIA